MSCHQIDTLRLLIYLWVWYRILKLCPAGRLTEWQSDPRIGGNTYYEIALTAATI